MLGRFARNNRTSVVACLLAVCLTLVAVIAVTLMPAGKSATPPNRVVASPVAQPTSLTAKDFPLGNYQAGVLRNYTDPSRLVSLVDLRAATHQPKLEISRCYVPALPAKDPNTSCDYGSHIFSIEVDTEKPKSYAIFNNAARLFAGSGSPADHIIAIDPLQLAPLGIRYGVWLMHGNTYLGTVFRTQARTIKGVATEANITLWCPGSLTKSALDGLVRSAAREFGK